VRLARDLDDLLPKAEAPASPADLTRLASMVRESLGIDLRPFKSTIVLQRLTHRIKELGLRGMGDYLDLLEGPDANGERDKLISAITTNVTQFFRESHHFDLLAQDVLPSLLDRARAGGRVRLWSAGCSSGQEPFSIAASILDLCPEAPRLDIKVLATDVDAAVLGQAKQGTYGAEEVRKLPQARRLALFGDSAGVGSATVRADVSGLVAFKPLNLVDPWPMRHPFDVIFCRNVAIYFDANRREHLWQRFVAALSDGGRLFLGHSERVLGPALAQLEHAGVTTYRKRSGPLEAPQSGL
jgi:chemotaxis protein methyltransferase CheR